MATTFSVDGAFYDSAIQRRLVRDDCVHNILLADAHMLAKELTASPEAFARGRPALRRCPRSLGPLMTMLPNGNDRDRSVAIRALSVLEKVWVGQGGRAPLCQRLRATSGSRPERTDAVAFARLSRWMVARCLLALENAELARIVELVAVRIAATTLVAATDR